jgi:hypothetical protein
MSHVFSTNRVKLAAQKPKAIDNLGEREYILFFNFTFRYIEKVMYL